MDELRGRLQSALAGRYDIERELGRGGMATVWLARDLKHPRRVAVKVLRPELAAVLGPERFLQEIEIAARLTHPNILPLFDSGEAADLLYYVMPYVEGESLRDRLERERNLDIPQAIQILGDVAAALGYAHRHGVIHRDIKPENILLGGEQAVVADFGIARAIDAAGAERLTATGLAVGTPAYMSPEQAGADRSLDARTDIYSLGCVAYEMLGGVPPFLGPSAQAVMARHAADPAPALRTLRPTVPEGVERAIERALAKVPADRFATVEDFAAACAGASTAEAIAAERRRVGRLRRRPVALLAGLLSILALVAAVAWWQGWRPWAATIRRFAILPFENPTADTAHQYFLEGLHDALISDVAGAGLGVIARTSVAQYRHTDKPVRVIARELGVDAVVETSLLRTADSVRMLTSLVDGHTEQVLWTHDYEVSLGEVPALSRAVAQGIAGAIRPASRGAPSPVRVTRTVDPQAYDLYLQGESYLHRPSRRELEMSREYFEHAIARDSTYAPAWAGLSATWAIGRQRGYYSPAQATPPSQQAAYKALALDSTLAEPHYVLAEVKVYGEWDWDGADREFRRAIALRPDYAEAHAFYAHLLCILHRPKEAVAQMDRARQLDPLDPLLAWIEGAVFTLLGRYDDATARYRAALARAPGNPAALWLLWVALQNAGRSGEAYPVALQAAQARGDSGLAAALEGGHQGGGYTGAMRSAADYLAARARTSYIPAWDIAIWYAAAGERDQAMDRLEEAYRAHDPTMPYLGVHPSFNSLHADPRFQTLLRRMRLPA
jgi:eukaryotic-like serine/threonine-protein kinase